MTKLFSFLLIASSLSFTAKAEVYPVLDAYLVRAQEVKALIDNNASIQDITAGTQDLVTMGVDVMKLYASKNPVCTEQFEQMISEVPQMPSMSVQQLHDRYHDADGLPEAPRHCYFGRSQVVHPAMNIVRLSQPWTEETKAEVMEETEEVIHHVARIQKNLDNPPN